MSDYIQTGDVFAGKWGETDRIHVILPQPPGSAKKHFIRQTGTTDSTWSSHREGYWNNWSGTGHLHYIGIIPLGWLDTVIEAMKTTRERNQ